MSHPIYGVVSFEIQAPYTLRVCFDDGTDQVIDFQPYWRANYLVHFVTPPCSARFGLILKSILWYGRTGLIGTRLPCMTGPNISLNFREWPSAGLCGDEELICS